MPTSPSVVKGVAGGSVTVRCPYDPKETDTIKYWCRWKNTPNGECPLLVQSQGQVQHQDYKGRLTLSSEPGDGIYTVVLSELTAQDAGFYWCLTSGDDKWTTMVELKVDEPHGVSPVNAAPGQGPSLTETDHRVHQDPRLQGPSLIEEPSIIAGDRAVGAGDRSRAGDSSGSSSSVEQGGSSTVLVSTLVPLALVLTLGAVALAVARARHRRNVDRVSIRSYRTDISMSDLENPKAFGGSDNMGATPDNQETSLGRRDGMSLTRKKPTLGEKAITTTENTTEPEESKKAKRSSKEEADMAYSAFLLQANNMAAKLFASVLVGQDNGRERWPQRQLFPVEGTCVLAPPGTVRRIIRDLSASHPRPPTQLGATLGTDTGSILELQGGPSPCSQVPAMPRKCHQHFRTGSEAQPRPHMTLLNIGNLQQPPVVPLTPGPVTSTMGAGSSLSTRSLGHTGSGPHPATSRKRIPPRLSPQYSGEDAHPQAVRAVQGLTAGPQKHTGSASHSVFDCPQPGADAHHSLGCAGPHSPSRIRQHPVKSPDYQCLSDRHTPAWGPQVLIPYKGTSATLCPPSHQKQARDTTCGWVSGALRFIPEVWLEGFLGGSITIECPLPETPVRVYLCRTMADSRMCTTVISNQNYVKQEYKRRVSLMLRPSRNVYLVEVTSLAQSDSGVYACGAGTKTDRGRTQQVILHVSSGRCPPTVQAQPTQETLPPGMAGLPVGQALTNTSVFPSPPAEHAPFTEEAPITEPAEPFHRLQHMPMDPWFQVPTQVSSPEFISKVTTPAQRTKMPPAPSPSPIITTTRHAGVSRVSVAGAKPPTLLPSTKASRTSALKGMLQSQTASHTHHSRQRAFHRGQTSGAETLPGAETARIHPLVPAALSLTLLALLGLAARRVIRRRKSLARRVSRQGLRTRVPEASRRLRPDRPRAAQRPRPQNIYSACPRRARGADAAVNLEVPVPGPGASAPPAPAQVCVTSWFHAPSLKTSNEYVSICHQPAGKAEDEDPDDYVNIPC
ncbi:Fas apoptotic inhibitory molecule 3 [Galemys pyrenaicus]|uniref:Fas apoptotic inhibitory molecule 3 n=1 Tax=Galemys pyrenaicus TaxID=202257 RepID=A0A8J6AAV5_GALPY|nr:Fas apoptotic inhibitory molecule 3 [Galemys pyrenaicus]